MIDRTKVTMANITGVLCQIITGNISGAGTDGDIYLGLCGREFHLDSDEDDYERGSWREYILGTGPLDPNPPPPQIHVRNPDKNDPASEGFPLNSANLDRSPIYIRFEPEGSDDNWNVASAVVLVYTGTFLKAYLPPREFDNLWLGKAMGKVLFLTQEISGGEEKIRDRVRELAERLRKERK
jgi:hypothetical protein